MLQHEVFWQRGWICMRISHCCCSVPLSPFPVCSSDGVLITPGFFVPTSSFLPPPLYPGRKSFPFTGGTGLFFLLLKQNKTQKNVLFLNYILQKNKTSRFYFILFFLKESRKNKKNSRKQVQLCWCNPSKIILPGWRGVMGARLKFGIKEIWGPDTKSLLRKHLSVFSGHGQHSVKYLRGDHFQEAWLLAGYLIV